MATTLPAGMQASAPPARNDVVPALAATLVMLAFHAISGMPTLSDLGGDNDSMLRLVQVRDLLGGQGWFDPMQYRMGLESGFAMHWSRLVDLPVALLVATLGETVARVLWPTLLFFVAIWLMLRIARRLASRDGVGQDVVLPAAVIGGVVLHYVDLFPPGALDHHNVQLVLALATLLALLHGRDTPRAGAIAGGCAALMLAIGMETAPLVATACAIAAISSLGRVEDQRMARSFGIAFSAVAFAVLMTTLPPSRWLVSQCDAFSFPQASLSMLGGVGLALVVSARLDGRGTRLFALGCVGIAAASLALAAFPQCLGDPFADLDPRLRRYWLDLVSEARPVTAILRSDVAMFAGYYATPLLAAALLVVRTARQGVQRNTLIVGLFLVTATLVSFWQVRGSMFSLPLAAIVLSVWVAGHRAKAARTGGARAQLAMAGAWLISFSTVWHFALTPLAAMTAGSSNGLPAQVYSDPAKRCYAQTDYAALAALPRGTVLATSNLGSAILMLTPHHALAGPYHRNVDGNLATLDLLMGDPVAAEAKARRLAIDYLAICPQNHETLGLAGWAPGGLLALLARGDVPNWLETTSTPGANLRIFRVVGR